MGKNLITGGLGFVGSYLARYLVQDGEEVVLFDLVSKSESIRDIEDSVEIVEGDLCNWAQLLDVVKNNNIDCIYHAGAILSVTGEANPQLAYQVNVNGTFNILEAARLFNVGSVVYTSTTATYGLGTPSIVNEDAVQMPTSIYGVTKICCERLGEYYHSRYRLNFRGVRYPSIIGPGRANGISRYSSEIIQMPALGHPYQANVSESVKLSILYVKDAVKALINLKRADEVKLKRRIYTLSGVTASAGEEAELVRKYLPQAHIEFHPDETIVKLLNDMPSEFDSTRARQEWGFHCEYTLDEAIKDFINEVQANPNLYE